MGAASVESIQSKDLPKALNALTAKKRQMAALAAAQHGASQKGSP